jgi:hypothetical protein
LLRMPCEEHRSAASRGTVKLLLAFLGEILSAAAVRVLRSLVVVEDPHNDMAIAITDDLSVISNETRIFAEPLPVGFGLG